MQKTVTVIGGGLVGLCCAIFLRQDGHQVCLIDRRTPGRENSASAAGMISRSDFVPIFSGKPIQDLGNFFQSSNLVSNLTSNLAPHPAYHLDLKNLPAFAPWLLKSWKHLSQNPAKTLMTALDSLQRFSLPMHQELARIAGVAHLIQQNGLIKGYRTSRSYQAAEKTRRLWREYGVSFQTLTQSELYDLEPAVQDIFHQAIWIPDAGHILDPGKLADAYLHLFVRMGGVVKRAHVTYLQPKSGKMNVYTREQAEFPEVSDEVVIALGPWSSTLLSPLGYQFPVIYARGYQQDFAPNTENDLNRPIEDVAGGFYLSPQSDAVRVTTGFDFISPDHQNNENLLHQAVTGAKQILSFGPPTASQIGSGSRPLLPDSLPIISRAHKHNHLWFAFGHHQIGVSSAAVTGKLISDLLANRQTSLDMTPYASVRFS